MTSRSEKARSPLSAAYAYAERGWPVFPLVPRDKAPLTKRGFQDATTDRNDILRWWQAFPDANIGLATGVAFSVLDIDSAGAVPVLQELLGETYRHDGPVVSTGKGAHLYFQPLKGDRNRAGLLGGKVDYRGAGGYVVAPPSIHPSGRVYVWSDGRDERRDLPVVPEALARVILKAEAKEVVKGGILQGGEYRESKSVALVSKGTLIIERPNIMDVCAELGLKVSPKGVLYFTNCIFHADPGPSLALYPDNTFHCYGCEAHGDSKDLLAGVDMTGRKAI